MALQPLFISGWKQLSAYSALVLFSSNTANIHHTRTGSMEVHASWA